MLLVFVWFDIGTPQHPFYQRHEGKGSFGLREKQNRRQRSWTHSMMQRYFANAQLDCHMCYFLPITNY